MRRRAAAHDARRNRMLRRVDWRFLCGPPEPERVYCPVRGELGNAVRHIARAVARDPEPGTCDLVVLRDPTSATLRRAVTALAAGGSAYVEWWLPRPGGVAAARRRLAAAGLEDDDCYWPWPPPLVTTALFWIPVNAPHVASWFLERHAGNHASRRAAAIRSGWRALWRHGALVPLCMTARKPPVRGADAVSLPGLLARAGATWAPSNGARACALLTGGRSPRNKLVALGFSASSTDPTVVVKMARVPEAGPPLEHEAAVLEVVHARRSVEGVPRLLGRATVAGCAVVAESYIGGRPLSEVLRAETHRALALQVTDLLAALAANARPAPAAGSKARRVASALEALPPRAREPARAALVRLDELLAVCEHRDCSPWNVLVQADGRVALLDWESAEAAGLPLLDLIYFLAYAAFFVEGTMHTGREPSSYRRMLDPATPVGRVYDECMRRYCAATSVGDGAVPSLRLLCWLTHARAAQVLQAAGPTGPSAHLDARLFLALAREELGRAG